MVKLIAGIKGSGKTKTLIDLANEAGKNSEGSVICIERGTKLIHEIKYYVRLIDISEYHITTARSLYGFICGAYASNHDITHVFIDSGLKIRAEDIELFCLFINEIDAFSEKTGINFVVTASIAEENVPDCIKKYI